MPRFVARCAMKAERNMSSQQLAIPEKETEMLAAVAPQVPSREQIDKLEATLSKMPQLAIETNHYHVKGLYAREIHIPAGTLLTGKVHKAEHLNIVSKGEIAVWTEDGMRRIKAPFVLPSYPSAKRVGFAIVDTVWVTIHATDKIDLAELEEELIENSTPAIAGEVAKWLG